MSPDRDNPWILHRPNYTNSSVSIHTHFTAPGQLGVVGIWWRIQISA
jgi:hypothetical protein